MSATALQIRSSEDLQIRNLSETELEIIIQVVQRDFELKAAEKGRMRRQKKQLKEADDRVTVLSASEFNNNFCIICFRRFWPLFVPKRCCYSCQHYMCRKCSCFIKINDVHICLLCQKERSLKSMGCDWYYGLMKNRFNQDASELVAQTLFSDQGQYNAFVELADAFMSPDLLQRVKGAQISQYRQKIESKWEELEERLRILELSEINQVKRENAFKFLREEYKIKFRDILKDFSQVLYVTLENYAARVDDTFINVNEQVVNTVHEEVEQLIGYKVNCIPDDMGSIASEAESTASIFGNHHIEDKLSLALVDKIFNDHTSNVLENYDMNFLDLMHPEDHSSTTTYLFQSKPPQKAMSEGSSVITKSSIPVINDHIEINETLATEYQPPSTPSDLSSDVESQPDNYFANKEKKAINNDDIGMSSKGIQHVLQYSGKENIQRNERSITTPRGEPINLLLEINGPQNIDAVWSKSDPGKRQILESDGTIEIINQSYDSFITTNLKIWDSKLSDSGTYTVIIEERPVARFIVKVIQNERIPEQPNFRLEMMPSTCRAGQNGEFTIEVNGYPEPRVRFYHNNKLIKPESNPYKYKIDHSPNINRYTLRIIKAVESDAGIYKCRATNFGGSSESNSRLNVTGLSFRFESKDTIKAPSDVSSVDGSVSVSGGFGSNTNNGHFSSITPSSIFPQQFSSTNIHSSNPSLNQTSNKERHTSSSGSEMDSQIYVGLSRNKSRDRYVSSSGSEGGSQLSMDEPSSKFNTIKRNVPPPVQPKPQSKLKEPTFNTMIGREVPNQYMMALPSPEPYSGRETFADSDSDFSQILQNVKTPSGVSMDATDSQHSRNTTITPRYSADVTSNRNDSIYQSSSNRNNNNNNNNVDDCDSILDSNRQPVDDTDSELSVVVNKQGIDMDTFDESEFDLNDDIVDPTTARQMAMQSARRSSDAVNKVAEIRRRFEDDQEVQSFTRSISITKRTPPVVQPRKDQPLTREVRIRSISSNQEE